MLWQRYSAHLFRRFEFHVRTKRRSPITQLAGVRAITYSSLCKMTDQVKYLDIPDKSETDKKLYK